MSIVRRFRLTAATKWYDDELGGVREVELHFVVAKRGSIRRNRTALTRRAVTYTQREIFRHYGKWIPKNKLRLNFEREEPASRVDPRILVRIRSLRFRGQEHSKDTIPTRLIPNRAVRNELGIPSHIINTLNRQHQASQRRIKEVWKKVEELEKKAHKSTFKHRA